jgi:general nucleoside transport system permease protein
MAQTTIDQTSTSSDRPPDGGNPLARMAHAWGRVSASIVPVLAVITALIVTIPLMVITQGGGDIGQGLRTAAQAYGGLLEGSVGLTVNDTLSPGDLAFALDYVERANEEFDERITAQDINILSQRAEELAEIGREDITFYASVIDTYLGTEALPDAAAFDRLGDLIPDIQRIGTDRLQDYRAFIVGLEELDALDVRDFSATYGSLDELEPETRLLLETLIPEFANYDDETLITAFARLEAYPFAQVVIQYERFTESGEVTEFVQEFGAEDLQTYGPIYFAMDAFRDTGALEVFTQRFGTVDAIDSETRQQIETLIPAAEDYTDNQLLDIIRLLRDRGFVRLQRASTQAEVLIALDLDPADRTAQAIAAVHEQTTDRQNPNGVATVQRIAEVNDQFDAVGIDDIERLAAELRLVANLYGSILTLADVENALAEELPQAVQDMDVIKRPNNQFLIFTDTEETFGIYERERIDVVTTVDEATGEEITSTEAVLVPDKVFLQMGERYLLFSPANLEQTLVRSLPYIIAGLAVALGFRAGLFNIGAEGQLLIGATLATWIGYSTVLSGVPGILFVPLVLMAGLLGGALWGMIPGLLKAYTGAHEVINTIMLNFVAILLVSWLIRSTDPYILRDPEASIERTPLLNDAARLPTFNEIGPLIIILAGIVFGLFTAYTHREAIQQNRRAILRPVSYGLLVIAGGFVFSWLAVDGALHIGLVVMLITVAFVDWFLKRTTYGFELRTVGTNADAARYAGMNVKLNIVLAMTLSGGLAGLAGIVQVSGVSHSMEPGLLANIGFDAIAVALLARNQPRNIIFAGLLWGALVTGSATIQIYGIPIDLIQIIQGLIIIFIAADAIIRTIYFIPEATEEEKAAAVFSKGWGG